MRIGGGLHATRHGRSESKGQGEEDIGRREAEERVDSGVEGNRQTRGRDSHGKWGPSPKSKESVRSAEEPQKNCRRQQTTADQDLEIHVVAVGPRIGMGQTCVRSVKQAEIVRPDAEQRM